MSSSPQAAPEEFSYKDTVLLPDTDFNQRANAINREPELHEFWKKEGIYESLKITATEKFVLHDGPPYANGDLHIGHALNKILKDFINRYQMLEGKYVEYVPGWDCHGLPIELKVLQSMKSKERKDLTPIDLRKKAASFAKETVEKQSASFQRYGIWGEWDSPYMTLQPAYEAAQIDVFGKMYLAGHIYRGFKPVHWSPSSRTALAEAELEYPENHISKSIYVGFDTVEVAPCLEPFKEGLRIAIWTTTPWTIPANLAVAVNAKIEYAVVSSSAGGNLLVAADLVETLASKLGVEFEVLATFKGSEVTQGTTYRHPLYDRVSSVLEGGDYITTETGTGLVHTAPGHGQEDYMTGLKYGLELLSPVNDAGRFTDEAGERFAGMDVLMDGNTEVIAALEESGNLLVQEDYNHKYPYDWRTKKPTIFRATDQWFASVDNFRESAMEAIESVKWTPEFGKNRISSMTASRSDWCISRQRSWGVPIPVFYHVETGEALLTEATLAHIRSVIAEHGSDAWFTMEVEELLPEALKAEAAMYVRGKDTMDVWFDSGSSWAGVVSAREGLSFPADLYLEGSDQHRGWFQSSLLTSVAAQGVPPYKQVLTHGFVLDEKGTKMSKSIGNVVDPLEIINGGKNLKQKPAYGADVLRLWVASVDYTSDVCIGDNIIKQVFESYRRLRNTARYLIGNLKDFDPAADSVPYDELASMDKFILGRFSEVAAEVTNAYENYQFFRASQALLKFATSDLSSFYLDIAKDRLYISAASDARRRSCQTVFKVLVEGMAKLMAPILPHMAEDIWLNLPYETPGKSVFQGGWNLEEFEAHRPEAWTKIIELRGDVQKCMELARARKLVGSSMDCQVQVHTEEAELASLLEEFAGDPDLEWPPKKSNAVDDLKYIFIASKASIASSAEEAGEGCGECVLEAKATESGCTIGVKKMDAVKCERCWMYCKSVGTAVHPNVCPRCSNAVSEWKK